VLHLEITSKSWALCAAFSWMTALACFAGLPGCQAPTASDVHETEPPAKVKVKVASQAHTLPPGTDWRAWAEAESQRIAREDPATFEALSAMVPVETRGGKLRLLTPVLRRPGATQVVLARLHRRSDPAPLRRALVEVIPITGGPYGEAIEDLLAEEPAPSVRAELASLLERAPVDVTAKAVRRALADEDGEVRAAALFSVAARTDGASYTDAVVTCLSSPMIEVREAAIHAASTLRLAAAKPALASLVITRDALRSDALLALHRVDPEETRAKTDLDDLAADR